MNAVTNVMAAAEPPPAPTSGSNGVGQPAADPRAVLDAMVAQRELPTATDTQDSPTADAQSAPEQVPAAAAEGEAGENTSPPQNEPEVEGDNSAPETTDEAGASPGENAEESDAKKPTKGEQRRIDQLTAQKYQALERAEKAEARAKELEAKLEEATSVAPSAASAASLPESVSKLKTVAEVESRLAQVESDADALTDFLDGNPGEADTAYTIGDKQFTRAQLIQRRAALRAEARALPQQREHLVTSAQFSAQRKQVSAAMVKEFPVLQDTENPVTKTWHELRKLPQFQREVNGDELAYLLARGHAAVQAERAAKTKSAAPAAKPTGKVPVGKPHAAGNTAGARTTGDVKAIMQKHSTERNPDSFTALLSATGR